jgi:hypothetical protein
MPRTCLFCGGRPGSGEHAFPFWLNGVFDQLDWSQAGDQAAPMGWSRGAQDFRTGDSIEHDWRANEVASLINRKLCHACNTGWMADLEGVTAPLLTPMILGRAHTLTQSEQITVATWAAKTVMVLETSLPGYDAEFAREDRALVMNENRPPGHLRMFAAAVEGIVTPTHFGVYRKQEQQGATVVREVHLYNLQLHMLVLQVVREDPPAPVSMTMSPTRDMSDYEVRMFPPTIEGFYWPPARSFDHETLQQYMTRTENPPDLLGPSPT